MIDSRRVARNFLSLSLAHAVGFLCGLATTILLARALGPGNFGILGFGQAFIAFAGILVVMGTDVYGAREIARDAGRTKHLVAEILGLRIVAAALVIPALVGVAFLIGNAGPKSVVLSLQALGLIATVVSLDFVFQGVQRMGTIALRQAAAAALVLAGTAALVRGPEDVYVAAVLPFVALSVTSVWLMRRLHTRIAPVRVAFEPRAWTRWIPAAVPIGLGGLSLAAFQYTDVLMLGFSTTEENVGRYVALGRLYVVVVTVGNLLAAALAPVMAQQWAGPASARAPAYRLLLVAVLTLGGPPAAALAAFPGEAIALLYGAAYATEPGVLSVIMLSAAVFLGVVATSTALVAWDDQLFHTKALAVSALLNIALNAALIPAYGLWGAAVATLVSVSGLLAIEMRRLARRHGIAEIAPAAKSVGLLAGAFGLAWLARHALDAPWLDQSPALVLVLFGGRGGPDPTRYGDWEIGGRCIDF